MAIPAIPFGDTFLVNCTYADQSGTPIDLDNAGITVVAKIVVPSGMGSFPVTVTPAVQSTNPGEYSISADTSTWVTDPSSTTPQNCSSAEALAAIDPLWPFYELSGYPGTADGPSQATYTDPPTIGEWQLRISYTSSAGTFSAPPIEFRLT